MSARAKIGLFLAFCTSVGVHGAAYASLSVEHRKAPRRNEISEMNFELLPLPGAPPEPEPMSKSPEPAATPATAVRQAPPANQPAKNTPAKASAASAAAAALDLSGVTLSNDTGVGFAAPTGDGSAVRGPTGVGESRVQVVASAPAARSAAKRPPLVDASDLSQHPSPPSLVDLLRANYPEEARLRGLRGSARLRARIDADGVLRGARLLSESSAGFGSACQRTVLGSHWSAPRDHNGSAVATEIVYTCHFEIDQ